MIRADDVTVGGYPRVVGIELHISELALVVVRAVAHLIVRSPSFGINDAEVRIAFRICQRVKKMFKILQSSTNFQRPPHDSTIIQSSGASASLSLLLTTQGCFITIPTILLRFAVQIIRRRIDNGKACFVVTRPSSVWQGVAICHNRQILITFSLHNEHVVQQIACVTVLQQQRTSILRKPARHQHRRTCLCPYDTQGCQ